MPDYIQYNPSSTPVNGVIIEKWRSADPSVVEGLSNTLEVTRAVFDALTKWKKVSGGVVVDMTQPEIDSIVAAEEAAAEALTRVTAKGYMDDFGDVHLILRALADIIRGEINILRALHSLPDRTLVQLKTAIKNKVDSGDVD